MEQDGLEDLIKTEFPTLDRLTYLDHAGKSLCSVSQHKTMSKDFDPAINLLANPHTDYGNLEVCFLKK